MIDTEKIAWGILCILIGSVGLYFAIKKFLISDNEPYQDKYGNKIGIWFSLAFIIIIGIAMIVTELNK